MAISFNNDMESLYSSGDEMLSSEFFKKFMLLQKRDGREILQEFPSEFRSERVSGGCNSWGSQLGCWLLLSLIFLVWIHSNFSFNFLLLGRPWFKLRISISFVIAQLWSTSRHLTRRILNDIRPSWNSGFEIEMSSCACPPSHYHPTSLLDSM